MLYLSDRVSVGQVRTLRLKIYYLPPGSARAGAVTSPLVAGRRVRLAIGEDSESAAEPRVRPSPRRQRDPSQEKARPDVGHTMRRQGVCLRCRAATTSAMGRRPRARLEGCHPSAGYQ